MLHTITNHDLTVTVSEMGAELQSVLGADGIEYLWQGDATYWKKRSPNLFPYIGRMYEKSYYMDGQKYQMPLHGFAPTSLFRLTEKGDTHLVFELTDNDETFGYYPRHFRLQIAYRLEGKTVQIAFTAENLDDKTMYFSMGGHPGFRLPMAGNCSFEDYRLRFSTKSHPQRILFDADYLVAGSTPYALEDDCIVRLRHDLFDDDALIFEGSGDAVTLETDKDPHAVTVTYPQMKYVGFWHTVKTEAPFVCIEPWSALPSRGGIIEEFETRPDLTVLEPGCRHTNAWSITIK